MASARASPTACAPVQRRRTSPRASIRRHRPRAPHRRHQTYAARRTQARIAPMAEPPNPYLDARREWNERYGDYIAQARNWRYAAFITLLVCGALALGVVWQMTQSRIVPYIVEVDSLGRPLAMARADKAAPADQRIVRAQLAAFVADTRSVITNRTTKKQTHERTNAHDPNGTPAFNYLNEFYQHRSPFERARTETVQVDIRSTLPVSDKTWQVEWTETDAEILRNSIGLYGMNLSWTQQL